MTATTEWIHGEKTRLKELSFRHLPTNVFIRVETPADLHDAIFFLLRGCHVTVEPVAGVLTSVLTPCAISFTHNADFAHKSGAAKVQFVATATRLARAVSQAVGEKAWTNRIEFEVKIANASTDRDKAVEALTGIYGLLNRRAHRVLTIGDIADLLEWCALLAPEDARLDIVAPYGAKGWGALLRRENDQPEVEAWRPAPSPRCSRSVIMYAEPEERDLEMILDHAARSSYPVGIVNGENVQGRVQGAIGMSADKSSLLGNYGLLRRSVIDLGAIPEAADQWAAMSWLSRDMLRSRDELPALLQRAWHTADAYRQAYAISIEGTAPTRDHRNHALYSAIKLANCLRTAQPTAVTCHDLGEVAFAKLSDVIEVQSGYADHACGATFMIELGETKSVARGLVSLWSAFVGANFIAGEIISKP